MSDLGRVSSGVSLAGGGCDSEAQALQQPTQCLDAPENLNASQCIRWMPLSQSHFNLIISYEAIASQPCGSLDLCVT
eukprot:m.477202 g.477202  ORF g.477202 m.477202 type:complete len:77 (-) comp43154_c0_seq1:57-287(-)